MTKTSASLLERLREGPAAEAWQRLVDLYTPLLRDWLRRHAVQPQDADDLVQEVLLAVLQALPEFDYDPQRGSFRGWLRTILVNRLRHFWRARQARPQATGDSDFAAMLEQLEDPHSGLSQLWDREHDQFVVRRLLELIEPEFEASTWTAFRRVALDGVRPADAAAELGVTVNAVFIAKSRVLSRLRQELVGLTGTSTQA
jgi:RNA polymerase sigma-70 factor (ECF subfamily)